MTLTSLFIIAFVGQNIFILLYWNCFYGPNIKALGLQSEQFAKDPKVLAANQGFFGCRAYFFDN